jgi:hypothetical protein
MTRDIVVNCHDAGRDHGQIAGRSVFLSIRHINSVGCHQSLQNLQLFPVIKIIIYSRQACNQCGSRVTVLCETIQSRVDTLLGIVC